MKFVAQLLIVLFALVSQEAFAEPTSAEMGLVRSVVAAELGIPVGSVADSKPLAQQLKPGDNLHFVEIVLELEKRTKKEVTDSAMKQVIGNFSMKTVAAHITVKQIAEVLSISPASK